jgi:hypothetical protein
MIGAHLGEDADEADVAIGIEIDRGPWVSALVAARYTVYAVNPLQVVRYRERRSVSGSAPDAADYWVTVSIRCHSGTKFA